MPRPALIYPAHLPRLRPCSNLCSNLGAAQRRSVPVIHEEWWGGLRGLSPQGQPVPTREPIHEAGRPGADTGADAGLVAGHRIGPPDDRWAPYPVDCA